MKDRPAELAALARQYQAFRRARKIKSVAELLRLVLLFAGLDWSAREIAAKVVLVIAERPRQRKLQALPLAVVTWL